MTVKNSNLPNPTFRYAFLGAAFGLLFPIAATMMRVAQGAEWSRIHSSDPLMWLIDAAPIVLGTVAWIAGEYQHRVEAQYHELINSQAAKIQNHSVELESQDGQGWTESAAFLKSVFEFSPNPIFIFDEFGIQKCNLAAVRALGAKTREEIIHHHPKDFSPELQPDGRSSDEKSKEMDAVARQTGFHRFEWTHKRLNGELFPVDVTLAPVAVEGHRSIIVVWNDLTEIKKSNQLLIMSSKMASLGEMAGGVAHEINNPLAIIQGLSGMIQRRLDREDLNVEKIKHDLKRIDDTVRRISSIIRGLRAVSRNSERDPMEPTDVAKIVQDTLDLCTEKLKKRSVDIRVNCPPDLLINCRPAQISQIIMNLIGNSLDALESQTEKWIEISAHAENNKLYFTFTDSGPGIPSHIAEKLMQPFFTTKEVGKGTGLGLSISRGIAQEHDGSFYYDSKSTNTRFCLELPLATAEAKAS